MQREQIRSTSLGQRVLFGALVLLLLVLAGLSSARATEIVPSVGVSHTLDTDQNRAFLGLELRTNVAPMVKLGLGAGYRSEKYYGGLMTATTVPLTASLWVQPVPFFYAGGGAGAYVTLLGYEGAGAVVPDASKTSFGGHVGGGFNIPLAPMLALDLQGRYAFLGKQASALGSGEFDPSFWGASAGLALKF